MQSRRGAVPSARLTAPKHIPPRYLKLPAIPPVTTPRYSGARWQAREPYLLKTCVLGIFAAGDSRAGAMARVAVGEGNMAIKFVHQYLDE